MPHTVPNRPTKGAVLPIECQYRQAALHACSAIVDGAAQATRQPFTEVKCTVQIFLALRVMSGGIRAIFGQSKKRIAVAVIAQ